MTAADVIAALALPPESRVDQRVAKKLLVEHGAPTAADKLRGYTNLYLGVLRDHRMCLCGMLAAEYPTLPGPMRASVVSFFDKNEKWLLSVLEQGRADGSLTFTGSTRDTARMIISCLEGAMLVARPYGDTPRFRDAAASLLASLTPATAERD